MAVEDIVPKRACTKVNKGLLQIESVEDEGTNLSKMNALQYDFTFGLITKLLENPVINI